MSKELIWRVLDLTSLNANDVANHIIKLCALARKHYIPDDSSSHMAAVCCYAKFCTLARSELAGSGVKLATVVNFPSGNNAAQDVVAEITAADADEIDVVFPYKKFLAGNITESLRDMQLYRAACGERCMKVILETAAFADDASLLQAADVAIAAGADFLKTSTGKGPGGATCHAVRILLQAIGDKKIGIKVSGGVRDVTTAQMYLDEIAKCFPAAMLTSQYVRIGASSLAQSL
jgi:deoxyribose-phosphate aldolase